MTKIIQDYNTIQDLWKDFELINKGKSKNSYWDTYENGTRLFLENELAKTYGSEKSLFLNCGMSALQASLEGQILKKGDVIITGLKSYFETTTWLEKYLIPRGVNVIKVDTSNVAEVKKNLTHYKPKVCLLETVINSPDCFCLDFENSFFEISSKTVFVIDNTIMSHSTKWFEIVPKIYHDRMLIVESGTKFITEDIMMGAIYGSSNGLLKIRDYARVIGSQLQQSALNYLNLTSFKNLKSKLEKQTRNVKIFREVLETYKDYFSYCNSLDVNAKTESQLQIFKNGIGPLIFLKLNTNEVLNSHRKLVNQWKRILSKQNIEVKIRAGFGFNTTSLRTYEENSLNQPEKPLYIRISVGCESAGNVKIMAQNLGILSKKIVKN